MDHGLPLGAGFLHNFPKIFKPNDEKAFLTILAVITYSSRFSGIITQKGTWL
jgi:hypothetical protein